MARPSIRSSKTPMRQWFEPARDGSRVLRPLAGRARTARPHSAGRAHRAGRRRPRGCGRRSSPECPVHRNQMGREVDANGRPRRRREPLLDFGRVAVMGRYRRRARLADLGEKARLLGLAPRARDSRLGVDDDVLALDQPVFEQRRQRQLRRGRVAARVRHEAGAAHLIACELGQAVDRLCLERHGAVRPPVPFRVDSRSARRKSAERSTTLRWPGRAETTSCVVPWGRQQKTASSSSQAASSILTRSGKPAPPRWERPRPGSGPHAARR